MTIIFLFKLLLVLLLLFVIFNLGRALYLMVKQNPDDQNSVPMSRYLGKRLIFSALVIALLLIAMATGLITPNPRPY
ncbi:MULTISPECIES: DUF2909 domain-containing protein [Vibrio]|uniref:DUF2909 domain-containing protein n=1 Tax=Vibrio casei TaxID=673372 RepID=A0A368LJG4_9VIBR|nr:MULTISPECIES: DUF2909 domain-containing protein [Vibrio]RCS70776.1 DUF2909 domain-containing protein [Vibrio casei]HBV76830.1 DUF2909 domain-containing protein [Vibrio sp.]